MQSLLDAMRAIYEAKPGERGLVAEQFDAISTSKGGCVALPIGTRIEIMIATRVSTVAIAEIDGRLVSVFFSILKTIP